MYQLCVTNCVSALFSLPCSMLWKGKGALFLCLFVHVDIFAGIEKVILGSYLPAQVLTGIQRKKKLSKQFDPYIMGGKY